MNSKNMAAFFDRLAPDWDNSPHEYEIREKLTSMMELSPNSVIADIGCGKGVMFEHLLKTNPAKIIAVDVSGEMLRLAKSIFSDERIEYINADFLTIELPVLDTAVIFNAYPHFCDKDALVKKLTQTVKTNGSVIIAHSRSRASINGTHTGERASSLSVPLENAVIEADKFSTFFTADVLVDNDKMYFVKLIKR